MDLFLSSFILRQSPRSQCGNATYTLACAYKGLILKVNEAQNDNICGKFFDISTFFDKVLEVSVKIPHTPKAFMADILKEPKDHPG